jgi:hypothetical protein
MGSHGFWKYSEALLHKGARKASKKVKDRPGCRNLFRFDWDPERAKKRCLSHDSLTREVCVRALLARIGLLREDPFLPFALILPGSVTLMDAGFLRSRWREPQARSAVRLPFEEKVPFCYVFCFMKSSDIFYVFISK